MFKTTVHSLVTIFVALTLVSGPSLAVEASAPAHTDGNGCCYML